MGCQTREIVFCVNGDLFVIIAYASQCMWQRHFLHVHIFLSLHSIHYCEVVTHSGIVLLSYLPMKINVNIFFIKPFTVSVVKDGFIT